MHSVTSILKHAMKPACMAVPQWEQLVGSQELVHTHSDKKQFGFIGAMRFAAETRSILRVTPDDIWRIIASKTNKIIFKFSSKLDVANGNTHISVPLDRPTQITAECLRECFAKTQESTIRELYDVDPLSSVTTSQESRLIRFGVSSPLVGVDLVGSLVDWKDLLERVRRLFDLVMSAGPASSCVKHFKKTLDFVQSMLDVFLTEEVLENLIRSCEGEDMSEWWDEILETKEGGIGWLLDLATMYTVEKPEKLIQGLTIHHVTIKLNRPYNQISRVRLVEGIVGFSILNVAGHQVVQCNHAWAIFVENYSCFYKDM